MQFSVRHYDKNDSSAEHTHEVGQLIYVERGMIGVKIGSKFHIAARHSLLWVPAQLMHASIVTASSTLCHMYFAQSVAPWTQPFQRTASTLMQTLIATLQENQALDERVCTIWKLIVLETLHCPNTLWELPLPSDPRLLRLTQRVLQLEGRLPELNELAKLSGASERTLQRLFPKEVGMSWQQWRQMAMVVKAMQALSEGCTVSQAAERAGLSESSSLAPLFKKWLGVSPKQWRV